jgi:hypothetical protein
MTYVTDRSASPLGRRPRSKPLARSIRYGRVHLRRLSPGVHFDNSFGWSVGAAYKVIPSLSVFAFLDGATAISPGQADPLELRVGAEYRIIRELKFTGAVNRGLSNGSADWGLSAALTLRF